MFLSDSNNKLITHWAPEEPNWWITSFDPSRKGKSAKPENLTAMFFLDFSTEDRDKGMFKAFQKKWDGRSNWIFDEENYLASYIF